jgi:hypothetical protein
MLNINVMVTLLLLLIFDAPFLPVLAAAVLVRHNAAMPGATLPAAWVRAMPRPSGQGPSHGFPRSLTLGWLPVNKPESESWLSKVIVPGEEVTG